MSRRSLRILLVEDDHEDAFLFQKRCTHRVSVQHVTTVANALAALRESVFDACFVDYRLGADSGLDFVRAARARHVHLPLVVITGQQIEVLGENALLAGATDFIPKENLDAETIERTVRWALIRRHVEVHREDQANAAIVSHLMGRVPPLATPPPGGDPLRRLLYVSLATQTISPAELLLMCSKFAAANARMGVTGVLIHSGERFLQAIEGPAPAIEILLRRIQSDSRHGQMQVILDEPAAGRLFEEWNMGLIRAPESQAKATTRDEAAEVAVRIRTLLGESSSRSGIERLLLAFPQMA